MAGLDWLTCTHFSSFVGAGFSVAGAGPVEALELLEATESAAYGGRGPEGQERLQFSLVFRGPMTPLLQQGTHLLTHEELGEVELFLVPIGPDADGMQYEAAFA